MRVAITVPGEERDELAGEAGRRQVRRHDTQEPVVLRERGDSRRHRRFTCAELDMRGGECIDELVEVEQLSHFRPERKITRSASAGRVLAGSRERGA